METSLEFLHRKAYLITLVFRIDYLFIVYYLSFLKANIVSNPTLSIIRPKFRQNI